VHNRDGNSHRETYRFELVTQYAHGRVTRWNPNGIDAPLFEYVGDQVSWDRAMGTTPVEATPVVVEVPETVTAERVRLALYDAGYDRAEVREVLNALRDGGVVRE
jgi:hypothetical protein